MAKSALVVDDSVTMRRILMNILKDAGFEELEQAADGQQAVDTVKTREFDLILMDWNMPNLTGFEALQKIRGGGSKIPIVMVTTEAEKSRVLEALRAGANNYIIKPFRADAVAEKIREIVG